MKLFILFLIFTFVSFNSYADSIAYECEIKAETQSNGSASATLTLHESSGATMNLLDFNFQVRKQEVSKDEEALTSLGLFINDASTFVPFETPWAYLRLPYSNGDWASILCSLK